MRWIRRPSAANVAGLSWEAGSRRGSRQVAAKLKIEKVAATGILPMRGGRRRFNSDRSRPGDDRAERRAPAARSGSTRTSSGLIGPVAGFSGLHDGSDRG